jgi:hypothetical protein
MSTDPQRNEAAGEEDPESREDLDLGAFDVADDEPDDEWLVDEMPEEFVEPEADASAESGFPTAP